MREKFSKTWSRREGISLDKKGEKMDSVLNIPYTFKVPVRFEMEIPKGKF